MADTRAEQRLAPYLLRWRQKGTHDPCCASSVTPSFLTFSSSLCI